MVEETQLGIKTWILKSVIVGFMLLLVAGIVEVYTGFDLLVHTIVAITIALSLGFIHEVAHYFTATKLGYKPKWYRTRFRMYFEIDSHSNRNKWIKDKKKIGNAPYYIIIPISVFLLFFGFYIQYFGIAIGGLASILLHAVSYTREGEE